MSVILHISDTHFGTEQTPVVDALLRLSSQQAPELIILSGDLTQRATAQEFDAARIFVKRLAAPALLVIPGNHDIPLYHLGERLLTPYRRYRRAFGADLEPVFESEALLVISVNTTRRLRHIEGEVSAAQIARVSKRLRQAGSRQLRLVVTHQPVHVVHAEDEPNLLNGGEQAIRAWAEAGADMILGGHIHRPYVCNLQERLGSVGQYLWVVQAGTALSDRIRFDAGNSVNLIRHDGPAAPQRCTVERWDFDDASQSFLQVDANVLLCHPRRGESTSA